MTCFYLGFTLSLFLLVLHASFALAHIETNLVPRNNVVVCWADSRNCGDGRQQAHPLGQYFSGCQSIAAKKGLSFCSTCTPKDPKSECVVFPNEGTCLSDKKQGCILLLPHKVSHVTAARPVAIMRWR